MCVSLFLQQFLIGTFKKYFLCIAIIWFIWKDILIAKTLSMGPSCFIA